MEKNNWITVGWLLPSNHQRSFFVVVEGRTVGTIKLETLQNALRQRPLRQVAIQRYLPQPQQARQNQSKRNSDVVVPIGPRRP
ncbi:MAG: hypothetical protein QW674_07050 [Candidatus Bathyarchaeia archaeon]